MRKLIIETLIGSSLSFIGFWLGSIYFNDFQNSSPLLLSISAVFVLIGIYMLFRAGRRDSHIPQYKNIPHQEPRSQSILEKNNELLKSYEKNSHMREKLRVIKRIG